MQLRVSKPLCVCVDPELRDERRLVVERTLHRDLARDAVDNAAGQANIEGPRIDPLYGHHGQHGIGRAHAQPKL